MKIKLKPPKHEIDVWTSDDKLYLQFKEHEYLPKFILSAQLFNDRLVIETRNKPILLEERIKIKGKRWDTKSKRHTLDKKCESVRLDIGLPPKGDN